MFDHAQLQEVRELRRTGLTVTRLLGDAAHRERFVCKRFDPPPGFHGDERTARQRALFNEIVDAQRALADGGAGHWVNVAAADDGEIIARHHPRSLERLAGRVRVDERGLHRIVESIVAGLVQIQETLGRPHGNLKPANVLIGDESRLEEATVVLTDPLPASLIDPAAHAVEDRAALGRMVFAAVVGREHGGQREWPVASGGPWSRLGGTGERWRDLTNRLLDPHLSADAISLEDLAAEVAQLRPAARRITPARLAAVVIVLVAGLVASGYFVGGHIIEREVPATVEHLVELNQAYERWGVHLHQAILQDAALADRLATSPLLSRGVVQPLRAASLDDLDPIVIADFSGDRLRRLSEATQATGEPTPAEQQLLQEAQAKLADRSISRRLVQAHSLVQQAEASLRTWLQADAVAGGEPLRALNWESVASQLQSQARRVETGFEDGDLVGPLRVLLAMGDEAAAVSRSGAAIKEARAAIVAAGAGDPPDSILVAFGSVADERVADLIKTFETDAAWGSPAEALAVLRTGLADLQAQAAALQATVRGVYLQQIDRHVFLERSGLYEETTEPSLPFYTRWRETLNDQNADWHIPATPDPRLAWGAPALAAEVEQVLARLAGELNAPRTAERLRQPYEAGPFARYEQLRSLRWVRAHEQAIRAGVKSTADELADALAAIRQAAEDQAMGLDRVAETLAATDVSEASPAINQAWRTQISTLRASTSEVYDFRLRTDALRLALADLDARLPQTIPHETRPTDRGWDSNLAAEAAQARRESALHAILDTLAWADDLPTASPSVETQAIEAYRAWLQEAAAVLRAMAVVERHLDEGFTPDETTAEGGHLAELLPGAEAMDRVETLKPSLDRLARRWQAVVAVTEHDKATLAMLARTGEDPALAVGAWRQLARHDWPADLDELQLEVALPQRLNGLLGAASSERRAKLRDELAEGIESRWRRCFNNLREQIDIEGAIALLPAVTGVSLAAQDPLGREFIREPHPLTAAARFNLTLFQWRQRDFSLAEDDAVVAEASQLLAALASLRLSETEDLRGRLEEMIQTDESRFRRGFDDLGPAATWLPQPLRWEKVSDPDVLEEVRYRHPGTGHEWAFRLVEPEGGLPVYVSTAEASVGVGLMVLDQLAAATPAEAQAVLAALEPVDAASFKGARAWFYDGRQLGITSDWIANNAVAWLREQGLPPYVAGSAEAQPAPASPLTALPPHVAAYLAQAMGCRLPTEAEWRAAAAAWEPDVRPNLRDQAFASQIAHVQAIYERAAQNNQPIFYPWPDDNVFRPDGASLPTGSEAAVFAELDDGILWFAPVTGSGHHLRGNVAEYVLNLPDEPAAPEAMMPFADVQAQLQKAWRSSGVMGASALSDPALAADQRQAKAWFLSRNGFSDVGFRPVFTAGEPKKSIQLTRLLARQPYVLSDTQ